MRKKRTFKQLHKNQTGKISDKWTLYLDEYERQLSPYQRLPIRLLEVGIQNGGSLEIWAKYFPHAEKIIGCDINPQCKELTYDDDRIDVVVSDVNLDACEKKITDISPKFDVIIDDGSHKSGDIISTFGRYFKYLNNGGIYIVEDLHASYWEDFDGGLHSPYTSMSFFKRLLDILNHEHWRKSQSKLDYIKELSKKYSQNFNEADLSSLHSLEFVNSLCIIRKESAEKNILGLRSVVGTIETVTAEWGKLDGTLACDISTNVPKKKEIDTFELVKCLDISNKSLLECNSTIATLEKTKIKLKGLLVDYGKHIAQLKTSLESVITDRDSKEAGLKLLQKELAEKSREHKVGIEQLTTSLESVITDRDSKEAGLIQLQHDLNLAIDERSTCLEKNKLLKVDCVLLSKNITDIGNMVAAVYEAKWWQYKKPLQKLIDSLDSMDDKTAIDLASASDFSKYNK